MENQTYFAAFNNNKQTNSINLKDGKQNLIKKRPSTTKLDLQKIFQQSIELTQVHKKLSKQNKLLKSQHEKVQSNKSSRQNLISMVQKIVQQKAKQQNKNPTNQSSWLVHKLNTKIYQLKSKIQSKQKSIHQIQMSKQSQIIRQKQCQIMALNQVLEFTQGTKQKDHFYQQTSQEKEKKLAFQANIRQIVWMQQQLNDKQDQILQAEKMYQQEQFQVRKLMMQISKKKAELKQIKQLQDQYYKAQQQFKQEKKKKQQRLAGNKTYLDELIQSRHTQLQKLQQLKQKYGIIQAQQMKNIADLEQKLQGMKKQYEMKNKARQQLVFKVEDQPVVINRQKWVKRVTFNQVKNIAKNLNYFIALKRASKQSVFKSIFVEDGHQLSIRQVIAILEAFPFEIQNYQDRELLARYCIEDAGGQGYFMQDMQTSEAVPIIKSVLSKLIGDVKTYNQKQQQEYLQKTGELMHKFHSLVQQNVFTKQGNKKKCSKQAMQQALIATQLDLHPDEINFIILYLFSWSHDIDQLEFSDLGKMLQKGVKWMDKAHRARKQIKPQVN